MRGLFFGGSDDPRPSPNRDTVEPVPVTTYDSDQLARFTPAMRQFLEIKARYPNTLVLFRMGDFYETFFEDAVLANRLIGITLTKRGKAPDGTPIPMAGVPFMTLDQYIARLVRLGESVVVVEQQGTPGKGMLERKISRIVTPGTLTDTALLPQKSDSILLSVAPPVRRGQPWGFAWITLSSGEFRGASLKDADLETALSRIAPSEVLIPEGEKATLRERFACAVTPVPDWHYDAERGTETLKAKFEVDHLDAWGVADRPEILRAVNALLDYTSETQVDLLPFILPLQIEEESDTIVIDAASRRNLEITDPIRSDSAGPTLFTVLDGCRTSMGSRTLKKWLNNPLRSREKALSRQAAISAFFEDEALRETVLDLLKTLPDLERITTRTAMKSVRPKELASLRDALPVLDKLSARLSNLEAFSALTPDLRLDTALFQKLDAAILEEPATLLRDGDVIKSEYHPELMDLRRLRDHTGNFLIDLEERERQATGIPTLRVEYNRVQGFYIEVSKAQSANVPARYTRRQTLKNTERYITEELKAFEDKAISARERSAALEKALYDHLVAELAAYVDGLMKAAHAVAALDVFSALADHARRFHWAAPVLSERPIVRIGKGRHPVVETVIETYVPADCVMGDGRRCLIITGPNMGGKSTYMRSVALITLLAWMGSFVPAESAEIGPIDRIHTRIGASDDLARGRSTFMVEMTEAAAILHQATDRSLVLMDEIGRGTSTFDGLSLASAICHELVQPIRAFTLFATHYFEVTQLAGLLKEAVNVHVSAAQDRDKIVFLHEINEGPANQSYGIAVAKLAGVPARVVQRAKNYMKELERRDSMSSGDMPDLFTSVRLAEEARKPAELTDRQKALIAAAESILAVDVDSLTPREALERLYDLHQRALEASTLQ